MTELNERQVIQLEHMRHHPIEEHQLLCHTCKLGVCPKTFDECEAFYETHKDHLTYVFRFVNEKPKEGQK